jgi:Mn-dependent DtxR family transcriptional regulator
MHGDVRGVEIADELNVSRPTVSIAIKDLEKSGLIKTNYDSSIRLTDEGISLAKAVTEKYDFFMDMLRFLHVDMNTAKEDACRLEHSLSEESFQALQTFFQNYMSDVLNAHSFTEPKT